MSGWFAAAWISANERLWNNEALITSLICLRVCVIRLEEKRAELERRGMRLSQIRSVGEPLRLGQLQGNHFDLVVRDLRPHGATDTHCSGTHSHARLAALIKEAVENVEVVFYIFSSTLQILQTATCMSSPWYQNIQSKSEIFMYN